MSHRILFIVLKTGLAVALCMIAGSGFQLRYFNSAGFGLLCLIAGLLFGWGVPLP